MDLCAFTGSLRICPFHLYQCGSKECLEPKQVCNGFTNCADGSDEGVGCAQRNCSSPSAPLCDHSCVSTPNGPVSGENLSFCWRHFGLLSLEHSLISCLLLKFADNQLFYWKCLRNIAFMVTALLWFPLRGASVVQVSSYSPAPSPVWTSMSVIQHQELHAHRFVRIHEGPTAVSATLGSTSSLITKAANQKV